MHISLHEWCLRDLLTLLAGVTVRRGHLYVIGGEETGGAVELSFPPVGVVLVQNVDQLTFGEAHLVPVGGCVVVDGDHLTDWEREEDQHVSESCLLLYIASHPLSSPDLHKSVRVLPGGGAGVDLPLLDPSILTLEAGNQPFWRFLPRA